jgi:flagellar M-ring protein FliF
MKRLLGNLSIRQRISIVVVAVLAGAGLWALVHQQQEADFKPLFTGVAAEDGAGILQKLKEAGVEYRLSNGGATVLVPSARLAELRLTMAAAGLPKTGRIGFELFDKTNLGATEFTEHVNYRRALEGELERSIMSLAEVEQARVHLTFPKESVFLDAQQPAKASVMVKVRPGSRMSPQNVLAINHLVASAVESLSPDAVSVVDMNGNLLARPRPAGTLDGPEPSEAVLDYRQKIESELLAKVNSTLEPLLGSNKFRAGVSVECDFSGGEQSEEIFDPSRSVMVNSQRTEDTSGSGGANGVPGMASTLPRPTSRPGANAKPVSRTTENITYQSTRTVKKTRMPAGGVKKMSLAVLVDQDVSWELNGNAYKRVLSPPAPEKLKIIRDLVAGVTGFSQDRGDQIVIETLPFESTLSLEPPPAPQPSVRAPAGVNNPATPLQWIQKMDPKMRMIAGGAAGGVLLLLVGLLLLLRKRSKKKAAMAVKTRAELPSGPETPGQPGLPAVAGATGPPATVHDQIESKLAEREALQQKMDADALKALKLTPVITKTAEVLAKHLREKISQDSETAAQILRTWIREEENS